MKLVRRLLVCALAVLVLLESGGFARAFGGASMIDCCCGVHSSARGCHCKDCPVKLRKARTDLGAAQLGEDHECAGGNDDAGVLSVLAIFPTPPLVEAPAPRGTLPIAILRALHPRFVSPVRPPP
jgi:hypothetical protein